MSTSTLDENIVAILDKLADIRRAMLWKISEKYNLTPLQIQILRCVKSCSKQNVSPSDIVRDLYISKATASSALKTLRMKDMIKTYKDEDDSRSYSIALTRKAESLLKQIEQSKRDVIQFLTIFPIRDKKATFSVLTTLVTLMHNNGIIDYAALCVHCEHCRKIKPHAFRCTLTGRVFDYDDMKVGCCNYSDKKAV